MKKQKLVAALMSIALGTSTVFSTVAFAEGTVVQSGVENAVVGTESSGVKLPDGIDWESDENKKATVYYDSKKAGAKKYHETLFDALKAAYMDTETKGTKEIYCKPGAYVGQLSHGHVADDLIIYGNGAKIVPGGDQDLEIDTWKYNRYTGTQANDGEFLMKDITVTVNNLDGIAAWGQRNTDHTINLEFNNCKNMHKILFRGNVTKSTGAVNITVKDCSFDSDKWGHKDTSIHSLYKGSINVIKTTFNKIDVAINLNNKSEDEQIITVENCEFNDCGLGTEANGSSNKTYAAPIRIVAKEGATSNLTVNDATFIYNTTDSKGNIIESCNGDILLGDGRHDAAETQGTTTLAITGTNANVSVQQKGHYDANGDVTNPEKKPIEVDKSDNIKIDGNGNITNNNPPIYIPPTPSEPTKTEIIGADRYETSAKIADKMGYYDTAILVNGDKSLSDGLSASSLAGKEKAPILLVKQNTIPKETLTRALKAKKVYIIGGTAAISEDVEKQLAGKEIIRVDGKNRVETSEKVAKLVGNYDEAFIVNGNTGEADAISVSSVAAKNQAPILLTNGKTSTHSKKTGVEYYVVGGDAVVSDSIVSEFDAERISGSDRYETNRAVIKEFYPNKNKYYYTKGDLLVDALAVSPLSKDNGVVLVSPKSDNSILKDKDLVQVGGMDFEINLK